MEKQNEKTRERNGKTEYFRGTFMGLSVWSPAPWENAQPSVDSTAIVEHEERN